MSHTTESLYMSHCKCPVTCVTLRHVTPQSHMSHCWLQVSHYNMSPYTSLLTCYTASVSLHVTLHLTQQVSHSTLYSTVQLSLYMSHCKWCLIVFLFDLPGHTVTYFWFLMLEMSQLWQLLWPYQKIFPRASRAHRFLENVTLWPNKCHTCMCNKCNQVLEGKGHATFTY